MKLDSSSECCLTDLCRQKRFPGHKKEKSRITIAVCLNADGSEKRPLIVIGTAKKPRCFKGINPSNLGIIYKHNESAWMKATIFTEWINEWEEELKRKKKKILLFLDNVSSHSMTMLSHLQNIRIVFLPAKTTARLQPLNAGIIQSFKMQYKKRFLRWIREKIDKNDDYRINLLEAIRLAVDAYDNVTCETIKNCWRKTGIIPQLDCISLHEQESDETDVSLAIESLNLSNPMTAAEYLSLDGEDEIEGHDDIEDIVSSLAVHEVDDEEEVQQEKKVASAEAMKAGETVRRFFEQQESDCTAYIVLHKKLREAIGSISSKILHPSIL